MDASSVSAQFKEKTPHKKSKKSKKEKKHKKSKSHKKKRSSSSSSSSGSSDAGAVWVEKVPEPKPTAEPPLSTGPSKQRDEWMTTPCLFACVTRDQIRSAKQPSEKEKEKEKSKFLLDRPGQSGRELNPYWANGGSGLPSEVTASPESLTLATTTVGDQGSGWLRRALQRAREQANESGRSLEEIAAERWGSLQKLEELLSEAEGRKVSLRDERFKVRTGPRQFREERANSERSYAARHEGHRREKYDHLKNKSSSQDRHYEDSRKAYYEKPDSDASTSWDRNKHNRQEKESDSKFRKPSHSEHFQSYHGSHRKSSYQREEDSSGRKTSLQFKKPDFSDDHSKSSDTCYRQGSSSSKNWRRKDLTEEFGKKDEKDEIEKSEQKEKCESKERINVRSDSSDMDSETESSSPAKPKPKEVLTDQQMNELAARLVKAEILGNNDLANDLKKKLELARQSRAANPSAVAAVTQAKKKEQEVIILTHTDSKGFARPLQTVGAHPEPSGGRRKKQKTDTHGADGQRLRYFPDDDKYSLQDMFQREKLTTVEDQNEMFVKLAGKGARQEHDLDMDDIFSERAREKESDGKIETRERDRAIREHQRKQKTLDNCQWCFESKQLQRHLVAAVGSKSYICLPPYQSLTDGHCLIVPVHHTTCATQLDEDVWEEIQDFRKAIVRMFEANDEDCIFFESAMHLNKFPHMVLHCVPLPRESGDMAPIYFKKAILESESEWASNKKVVDLSKKDVRRSIPKGLPYFFVDFGMQGGFAHVIEDEKLFPRNFAEEIIGGMLDLDHSIWRKHRYDNFDKQRKKSLEFSKRWKDYDFTKKSKEKRKRNDSNSSQSSSSS